jgi:hypothetical protein
MQHNAGTIGAVVASIADVVAKIAEGSAGGAPHVDRLAARE